MGFLGGTVVEAKDGWMDVLGLFGPIFWDLFIVRRYVVVPV